MNNIIKITKLKLETLDTYIAEAQREYKICSDALETFIGAEDTINMPAVEICENISPIRDSIVQVTAELKNQLATEMFSLTGRLPQK